MLYAPQLKPNRITSLLAEEARPDESEVKSEAAFQRLVSSYSELPHTPRASSDRGRYPEEAGQDESQREDTPSDDGDDNDSTFAFLPSSSESVNKPCTPASSVNGDDMFISDSPGGAMDIDMVGYSYICLISLLRSFYESPPHLLPFLQLLGLHIGVIRPLQRRVPCALISVNVSHIIFSKLNVPDGKPYIIVDDRYDPYPSSSKRRAVSPSLTYLRESHPSLVSPIIGSRTANGSSRYPIPIAIPISTVSSTASSPTISSYSGPGLSVPRPVSIGSPNVMSSPTMRASMGLASPVMRPVIRVGVRRIEGEEREVEGAGEAVGGLTLG